MRYSTTPLSATIDLIHELQRIERDTGELPESFVVPRHTYKLLVKYAESTRASFKGRPDVLPFMGVWVSPEPDKRCKVAKPEPNTP